MMRLTAIEEKQDTLMGEIATFEGTYLDDLAAANAAITTIQEEVLPDLEQAAIDNADAVADLEQSVIDEAANAADTTIADDVEAELAKSEILADYYFILDVTDPDIGD